MRVSLLRAEICDIEELWKMQVRAFSGLLNKYRDYETSPAAESMERVAERFGQPFSAYYFILAEGEKVGAMRVVDKGDGSRKRISPIFIMPEHRNRGYARRAILEAEEIYGKSGRVVETVLQEEGNLRLYEKLGYRRTGRVEHVNERMDLVFYEKD